MTLNEIKELYTELQKNYDEIKSIELTNELSKLNDINTLEFHYNILKKQDNLYLFYDVRGIFDEHGEAGKEFLLEKLHTEKDPDLKAEALFILGVMECQEVKPIALEFLKSKNYKQQYYGIIVIGWLGNSEDIPVLEKEMMKNDEHQLRLYAATALRQIFFNHAKLKKKIILAYWNALNTEEDVEVAKAIIACVQDLLKTKLGIRESMTEGMIGNLDIAKPKAIKAINKFLS
ncbi:HEAT repeat domain-containing protein [uncultured Apibacter sp.]|uniref:HEAT repeat domain-containing protein n=1 Tax=uncultured Apibacter sp. TaxID=1778616 RepID=UPI0025DB925B|nr:HEAT repeat domain-containing protein [uncultured Apibacter sp.]